jgi:hypothetical protein
MTLLGFMIGSRAIGDNSFFTHIVTGDLILESGSVPSTDPYSFTAAGEPWTVQSWLASLIYIGLNDSIGLWAVRLFHGVLAAFITAALWRFTEPARSLVARVGLIGLGLTVGAMMWSPRPLLIGLVAFVLVVQVLEKQRPLWVLLPTMWVWVNSHGSFPLVFALIGAYVGTWLDEEELPLHELRVVAWAVAGTLLGALNPVGPRLLWFPIALLDNREALEDVNEWSQPAWERPSEWALLALMFALLVAAKHRIGWRQILPAFGFTVLGLMAVRNINLAAIMLVVAAAPGLALMKGSIDGSTRGLVPRALAATAAVGVALVAVSAAVSPALDLERYPVEEVTWMEERGLVAAPGVNVIHKDIVGNYLHLRFGADARVFMDDRFDFYPQSVIDDHATLYFGGDFAEILGRYDADAVLWQNEGPLAEWLLEGSNGWTVVFAGDEYLVATPTVATDLDS